MIDSIHSQILPTIQGLSLEKLDEKVISKLHKDAKKKNSVTGIWSDQQNLIYAKFIQEHPYQFQTAQKRRRFKVFQRMAMHLPNRTSIQCRSHNQKMVKLAGSIQNVSKYIKRRIFPRGKKQQMPIQIKQQQKSSSSLIPIKPMEITNKMNQLSILPKQQQIVYSQKRSIPMDFNNSNNYKPMRMCIQIKLDHVETY